MSNPHLSVLIATHNRRERLGPCLDALAEQDEPAGSYEVIVADDGSDDGTSDALKAMKTPYRLRVLTLPKSGKPSALNEALAVAQGDVCLFIDDDVIASPRLVCAHLAAHRADPMTLGIGPLHQPAPRGRDRYAHAHARRWNDRFSALRHHPARWTDCYGGNFSAPRRVLVEIGGFATQLDAIEDIEIGYRLFRAGAVPRFLPTAEATHDDVKRGSRLLAEEERYGAFCAGFTAAHPETAKDLLGWFAQAPIAELALRRLALAMRAKPHAMAGLARLLPPTPRSRWLDFVSRFAFWRGVRQAAGRARWRELVRGVPVLMYHAFAVDGNGERFTMTARTFARQMRLLSLLRYRTMTLRELAESLRSGRPLPRRRVVVTIDDGYRDVLELAAPILSRRGFDASIYIVSDLIGGQNEWDNEGMIARRPLLDAAQILELRRLGFEIGAHTRTHRALSSAGDDELRSELRGSRDALRKLVGAGISTLTYPYGSFDERVARATAEAGFDGAATVEARLARAADDPLQIPRIEIHGDDGVLRFLRKLWFGGH